VRWSPEFPFPGQHSFSTHDNREPIARQLRNGIINVAEPIRFRKATSQEKRLLSVLVIQTTDISLSSEWLDNLLVRNMNDRDMGSLRLTQKDQESRFV
jgi:hypothetical protein